MENKNRDYKVEDTQVIVINDNDIEADLRELTKDELLHKLNYEVTDPDTIKLIKKILKDKQ